MGSIGRLKKEISVGKKKKVQAMARRKYRKKKHLKNGMGEGCKHANNKAEF